VKYYVYIKAKNVCSVWLCWNEGKLHTRR